MKSRILVILVMGLMISCGNDNKKNDPEVKTVDTEREIHEPTATKIDFKDRAIGKAYQQYLNLKTALVNSDSEKAQTAAKDLANSLEKFESTKEAREAREAAIKIADVSDLEAQREVFQYLTEGMINLTKGSFSGGEIYVQYCPMAFNNNGAYWLSNSKEIRNPYFGDKMLKCGEVKEVLK